MGRKQLKRLSRETGSEGKEQIEMVAAPKALFSLRCIPSATRCLCLLRRPRNLCTAGGSSSRMIEVRGMEGGGISLQDWQGWGPVSSVPAMVTEVIQDLKLLEKHIDAQMTFGGKGGKLQGEFGVVEDKKHRARYDALGDSEKKLQFFSARQIACRVLGSRGYLCPKCWLPMDDCMCSKVKQCSLWSGMRLWLYMHPKDFLRQNNTGKLLWQVFGVTSATLCIFGIAEDEDIMWNAFKASGKNKVWCLYPNKNGTVKTVQDALALSQSDCVSASDVKKDEDGVLHFVLMDGTWNNSVAMFNRIKERAKLVWGDEDLPCISLVAGASAMHRLRPQPSWDKTCTAAAAIALLSELQLIPQFESRGTEEQVVAVEDALDTLLEALTARRIRKGRSITRKFRHNNKHLLVSNHIERTESVQ